jgi:hypothetical protein
LFFHKNGDRLGAAKHHFFADLPLAKIHIFAHSHRFGGAIWKLERGLMPFEV